MDLGLVWVGNGLLLGCFLGLFWVALGIDLVISMLVTDVGGQMCW